MNIKHRPTLLLILDGYGIRGERAGNAVALAEKPELDAIFKNYPHMLLRASGEAVGLPAGQMGNSEVGHTNIGAGRVVYQDLPRITRAIADGSFFENEALVRAMTNAKGHTLHIMGLCSDGGVHSHLSHILALLDMAKQYDLKHVVVHCFLDGRDVPPMSASDYIQTLKAHMKENNLGVIGVVSGRYYAMDRDKRWERLEKAYDALTLSDGRQAIKAEDAIDMAYEYGETDEFVLPSVISNHPIQDGDSVIFANFRPDRARELTRALVDPDFDGFMRKTFPQNLTFVCMTEYDATLPNVSIAFPPEELHGTLGEAVSKQGLRQLRIAETEKYAHVTFFLNGGKEEAEPGEDRILVPSPEVPTYDMQPEMSAPIVTERVLEAIASDKYDLIILNFANPDMVGHTGNMKATVEAIEVLDGLVGKIRDAVLAKDGQILLTADHGNADTMLDSSGAVVTKHSLAEVPLCYLASEKKHFTKSEGKLADIAPTLLTLMGLEIPEEMTGDILIG